MQTSHSFACSELRAARSASIALEMMPGSVSEPLIVCVFPEAVCPYAMIVRLTPRSTPAALWSSTAVYTSALLAVGPSTRAKVKLSDDGVLAPAHLSAISRSSYVKTGGASDGESLGADFEGIRVPLCPGLVLRGVLGRPFAQMPAHAGGSRRRTKTPRFIARPTVSPETETSS